MLKQFLTIISLSLLLAACSGNGPRQQPAELEENFTNQIAIDQQWWHQTDITRSPLRPAVIGGQVFSPDASGAIEVLSLSSGNLMSSWHLNEDLASGLTTDGVWLYAGTDNGELVVLDLTGQEQWRIKLTSRLLSKPAVTESQVIVHTQDGYLTAVDRSTGQQQWVYNSNIPMLSYLGDASPIVAGNQVIAAFATGQIAGFNLSTGAVQWSVQLTKAAGRTDIERLNDVDADPIQVTDDLVLASGLDQKSALISISRGEPVLSYDYSGRHRPLPIQDRIVMVLNSDEVVAFKADNGEIIWRTDKLLRRQLTDPVYWNGYVTVADSLGWLHLIDPETGSLLARRKVDHLGVVSIPQITKEGLLLKTEGGRVRLLK